MGDGPSSNTRCFYKVSNALNPGLEMFGKNWKKIEELVKTRTGSQIRSHAQKYFLKFKKEPSIIGHLSEESHVSSCAKPLTVNLKEEEEEYD